MFGNPFGGFYMGNFDLDIPDELSFDKLQNSSSTAAEKTVLMVEASRSNYYSIRSNYMDCRVGGRRYEATLEGFGPKTAKAMADNVENHFKQVCNNALLDEDGNTTDATVPTTRMVNLELRRLRHNAFLMVAQWCNNFEQMMPSDVEQWNEAEYRLYGINLSTRYLEGGYQDFHSFLECFKLKPISVGALNAHYNDLYADRMKHGSSSKDVCKAIRQNLSDLLVSVLPHNEARLQKEADQAEKAGAIH